MTLRSADLTNANLQGADLIGADLRFADLTGTDLRCAELTDANLRRAELTDANLQRADLTRANLSFTDLTETDLRLTNLTGAILFNTDLTGSVLRFVDLSESTIFLTNLTDANLYLSDLTDAALSSADLAGVDVSGADLTNASLIHADLAGAKLKDADLTGAELWNANLTDASLVGADLTDGNLRDADLTSADVRSVIFDNIAVSVHTQFGSNLPDYSSNMPSHARAYHDLRVKLSNKGYDKLTRELYVLERKARTRAAFPRQPITFLGGALSGLLTGYGVRPRRVLTCTILFLAATTLWFSQIGVVIDAWNTTYDLFGYEFRTGAAYYSVVTFVTSPPHPPEHGGQFTRLVVMLETYVGTVLTVLLGYVLGNRSRI